MTAIGHLGKYARYMIERMRRERKRIAKFKVFNSGVDFSFAFPAAKSACELELRFESAVESTQAMKESEQVQDEEKSASSEAEIEDTKDEGTDATQVQDLEEEQSEGSEDEISSRRADLMWEARHYAVMKKEGSFNGKRDEKCSLTPDAPE
ncbi:hypothetical protein M7I_5238 [Glarea lozoyensis 74030]|uniref:Uncharacterized protein n=1 Tax=Glarea lozoyensis (strain ATCC 74030 / MF5533) TaxID=1104152 RepID=H0ERB9_GLAL7|nr:hypothetical protein M7I_5238 [Glarea lozoyensis 74030]